jgi:hypothetical protein
VYLFTNRGVDDFASSLILILSFDVINTEHVVLCTFSLFYQISAAISQSMETTFLFDDDNSNDAHDFDDLIPPLENTEFMDMAGIDTTPSQGTNLSEDAHSHTTTTAVSIADILSDDFTTTALNEEVTLPNDTATGIIDRAILHVPPSCETVNNNETDIAAIKTNPLVSLIVNGLPPSSCNIRSEEEEQDSESNHSNASPESDATHNNARDADIKNRRRVRNRVSASLSRERKRNQFAELEADNAKLRQENATLRATIAGFTKHINLAEVGKAATFVGWDDVSVPAVSMPVVHPPHKKHKA